MEKKTMGTFLAALRRAAGMTQRELAERLNVSDKSVSRWERDEGAPDLSLLPVLAEIFDVTCDELLRGQRGSPEDRTGAAGPMPGAQRQRRHLLVSTLSKYRTRTLITAGLALLGTIAAMIADLGFLRAWVGFFCGCAFFVAAVLCQLIFLNGAMTSVAEAELEPQQRGEFTRSVVRLTEAVLVLVLVLVAFCLPLILLPPDPYMGLNADSWVQQGGVCGGAALVLAGVVCWLLNGWFLRRGLWALPEDRTQKMQKNRGLQKRCALLLAAVLAVTGTIHWALAQFCGPWEIMDRQKFEDYDSFVAFMEQDTEAPFYVEGGTEHAPIHVYQDGQVTSTPAEILRDKQGREVCRYIPRNQTVVNIRWAEGEEGVLPLYVATYDDLRAAETRVSVRNGLFCAGYILECAAVLALYRKKRVR